MEISKDTEMEILLRKECYLFHNDYIIYIHMYYICALSLVDIATGNAPFSSIVYDDLPII